MSRRFGIAAALTLLLAGASPGAAQSITHRGFFEARTHWFPQDAAIDRQNVIVDVLARGEVFARPAEWLQIAGGLDLRANTGDQVADSWRPDIADRGVKRPVLSVRRLAATLTRGPVTIDAGKQFIRWGKTDIVTPTDRFAPRDFLNVFDSEFLAVRGVRGVAALSSHTIDAVWVPVFTPSRIPLLSKRWAVLPPEALLLDPIERFLPDGSQAGIRWGYTGSAYEFSVSFFDGFNHLPIVEPIGPAAIRFRFPDLKMYGADAAVPSRWVTLKGEAAFFASADDRADEYLLYVVQLERQQGEWLMIGGYAGEHVTTRRAPGSFAPDRGLTNAFVGRAAYTIDPNRSVAFETAVRNDLDGAYAKAEYSQAHGAHWRWTATVTAFRGEPDDFLGQYRRNSHGILGVRYSF